MRIGKNIHLVFLRHGEVIPAFFIECENQIRALHPLWNVIQWDEKNGLQFLNDNLPEYVSAYSSIVHNVQKADFLRLALVYVMGGFYMDMDIYPL